MKNLFLILTLLSITFSCSIEKRLYQKGYAISFHKKMGAKNEDVVEKTKIRSPFKENVSNINQKNDTNEVIKNIELPSNPNLLKDSITFSLENELEVKPLSEEIKLDEPKNEEEDEEISWYVQPESTISWILLGLFLLSFALFFIQAALDFFIIVLTFQLLLLISSFILGIIGLRKYKKRGLGNKRGNLAAKIIFFLSLIPLTYYLIIFAFIIAFFSGSFSLF